jgi:hypothetical protein
MYRRLGPLSELSPEDRRYYRLWWRKYTGLKLVAQIGLPVCLICGILSFGEQAVSHVARVIVHPTIWITVGCTLWWTFLDCPRCGAKLVGFRVQCLEPLGMPRVPNFLWQQQASLVAVWRQRHNIARSANSKPVVWVDIHDLGGLARQRAALTLRVGLLPAACVRDFGAAPPSLVIVPSAERTQSRKGDDPALSRPRNVDHRK